MSAQDVPRHNGSEIDNQKYEHANQLYLAVKEDNIQKKYNVIENTVKTRHHPTSSDGSKLSIQCEKF
jgi:hypothetical protein